MNDDRTSEQVSAICEKACAILKATNDGDSLSPRQLKLLEHAVNGFLNETGLAAFDELAAYVAQHGTAPVEWLYGVEGLRIDHEGFVYWHDAQFEHYTFTDDAGRKRLRDFTLNEAVPALRRLTERGVRVSFSSYMKELDAMKAEAKAADEGKGAA